VYKVFEELMKAMMMRRTTVHMSESKRCEGGGGGGMSDGEPDNALNATSLAALNDSHAAQPKGGDNEGTAGDAKAGAKLSKRQMRLIEAKRKQDLRNSDSDISDSGSDIDDSSQKKSMYERLHMAMREGAKAFARSFVDYGPPYFPHVDGVELEPNPVVDCMSEMNMSYVKLHKLLNERNDPNIPDPEDNYCTGMHYAGRHLHYLAARMIRRAGAEVNVINEWGQSPLHLTILNVISNPADPRRARQLNLVNWLIAQGANCSLRDKGGHEPLDFACMNNDMTMINILIEQGCRLRRDNYSLVAKRSNLLSYISDPDVYRFIMEHLKEEEDAFQAREEQRIKAEEYAKHDRQAAKNLASLSKRKAEKHRKQMDALAYERKLEKEATRSRNITASMLSLTSGKKKKDAEFGEWKADEMGNWHWEGRSRMKSADEVSSTIHSSSVAKMKVLEKQSRKSIYDERWRMMGGSGIIEAPWTRSEVFQMEGITDTQDVDDFSVEVEDELNVRDENDDLLEGEDMSGILDELGP
jgi:ankyrin repeat protein